MWFVHCQLSGATIFVFRGPFRHRGPYSQGAYTCKRLLSKGPIQTKSPYKKDPYKQGALQTRGTYRQGVATDRRPLQRRCTRQEAPADKGPLRTKCLYRQGAPTDTVQFLQTRGPYMIYMQSSFRLDSLDSDT